MADLSPKTHFIRQRITDDLASGAYQQVVTRFPPEPNGYLHIGHAKSICLNFSMAKEYQGVCHLRFDDTNPIKEEQEYVDAIMADVKWLGFDWGKNLFHASDYFEKLYQFAIELIEKGLAYVDSASIEEIKLKRGTLQEPGQETVDRNRPIAESLDLFHRMRQGEFPDGKYVLRAKIDMNAGNINMRDPIIYRIRHTSHQRTGDAWCIYPMYDYAHSLSDAIEYITHSLCTLEFQDHRPLYDWCIQNVTIDAKPQQIEFARLNLSHTITSKRKLKALVDEKHVEGWNDPRMPTLSGMRRRGYPPAAIRQFCEMIGISKSDSVIEMRVLEACVRDELNASADRAMAVLDPLKVIIENYPENSTETLRLSNHPQLPERGDRAVTFSRELWIEKSDFMLEPTKDFFRLAKGKEVRLRGAYIIRCDEVICNDQGDVIALRCHYDQDTLGKNPEGRKVKGVIHWLSAETAKPATVHLYDRLFTVADPGRDRDVATHLNPDSLTVIKEALVEPALLDAPAEAAYQFERLGYFCVDLGAKKDGKTVFNRIVDLREAIEKPR